MTPSMTRRNYLDALGDAARISPGKPALVRRAGEADEVITYRELLARVVALAEAFGQRGIGRGTKVLFLSDNRPEWIITDLALMMRGAVSVPRGSDTPTAELEFITGHAGCEFLIAETARLLEQHRELLQGSRPPAGVFLVETPAGGAVPEGVLTYEQLMEASPVIGDPARALESAADALGPADPFTIIYTSGTTGTPKGVVLNHGNILHQVQNLGPIIGLGHDDSWLSILPSWHIFERTAEYLALAHGNTLAYSTLKTFAPDLVRYRPTMVATVPRLWESLYLKVYDAIGKKGRLARGIFVSLVSISAATRRNWRILRGHVPRFEPERPLALLWSKALATVKLIALAPLYVLARRKLSAVQERFGGRLKVAISGGGSLPRYLEEWLDAVGIRITNAYGMTESSPGIAGRSLDCHVLGTLGPPMAHTELRIAGEDGTPVPRGQEGEIQVRGPQVMPGYHDNPEENAKAFTPDGFLRTGDLGRLTLRGDLVITGRAKEIIVLVSGENIDPTRIEGAIAQLPYVKDAMLVGQDQKGLGALVIPDLEKLKEHLGSQISHLVQETEDFLSNRHVLDRVKSEINKLLHPKLGFKPYEKIQKLSLLDREFKIGEELTNTLKKKRRYIEQKYREVIDRLFH